MNNVALLTNPQPVKPARTASVAAPVSADEKPVDGPAPAARNAMAETLRALLAAKKPPGRRP